MKVKGIPSMSIFSWTKKKRPDGMANWFPSIWKAICATRSWKMAEKRRYFYADMGIAVCPLSNSRTFWPFELTSDRRVSPILPISTLPSPNQGAIHKRRPNLSMPFLCPFYGAKYIYFFSFRSIKLREKYISFAQFVYIFFWGKCVYFSIFEW